MFNLMSIFEINIPRFRLLTGRWLYARWYVIQQHFVQRPKERPVKYFLDAIRFGQNGSWPGKRPDNIIPQR